MPALLSLLFPAFALTAPSLEILSPPGDKYEKGKPLEIRFSVKGAPAAASVGFFLEKDVPREKVHLVPGPAGALGLTAQNVETPGKGSFTWDGKGFGCAPTDRPMICETPAEPGFYVIRGYLYDQKDVRLVHGMRQAQPTDPKVVAEAKSGRFEITGAPDLTPVKNTLETAVRARMAERGLSGYSGLELNRYYEAKGELRGPDASGLYCRDFRYKPPLAGEVTACGPISHDTKAVSVKGEISGAPGVLPFTEAFAAAVALSEKPYLSRVRYRKQADIPSGMSSAGDPEATTYLSSGSQRFAYRADGGYWIFLVEMIKAGGSSRRSDAFADLVLTRVGNDGNACVLKTLPYKGGDPGSLFTDSHTCP